MTARKSWTRDELLVALNLYHKLNFGQIHARQRVVIEFAEKLGRGANSLAMKLVNFASLDPVQKLRGKKSLQGVSALDREMWTKFHQNLNESVPASEEAARKLFGTDDNDEFEIIPGGGVHVRKRLGIGPTETVADRKLRWGQEYFRNAVLNTYGGRCGVTQLADRESLVASRISPRSTYVSERWNVRNGLCLSWLHDAAFDRGLIAFNDSLRLLLSPRIKESLSQRTIADSFAAYEGAPLCMPETAAMPDLKFLAEHRARFKFKG